MSKKKTTANAREKSRTKTRAQASPESTKAGNSGAVKDDGKVHSTANKVVFAGEIGAAKEITGSRDKSRGDKPGESIETKGFHWFDYGIILGCIGMAVSVFLPFITFAMSHASESSAMFVGLQGKVALGLAAAIFILTAVRKTEWLNILVLFVSIIAVSSLAGNIVSLFDEETKAMGDVSLAVGFYTFAASWLLMLVCAVVKSRAERGADGGGRDA